MITPLNNLRYNLSPSNLATHGVHPWYQHILLNIPELLGPAAVLLFFSPHLSLRLYSAFSGIIVLSLFQHQEARFLLPTVPLILSSVRLPRKRSHLKIFAVLWITFNLFFGVLMGTYHQGGVVPTQVFLSTRDDATHALWWKTYSPPVWLLNGKNEVLKTHDLMGMKPESMLEAVQKSASCSNSHNGTYLIAPHSATFLDPYTANKTDVLKFEQVWIHRQHLNMDDLDFGDDGIWPTLTRVVGRRGLVAWRVTQECS